MFTESWIGMPDVPGPRFRRNLSHDGVQLVSRLGLGVVGCIALFPVVLRSLMVTGPALHHSATSAAVSLLNMAGLSKRP